MSNDVSLRDFVERRFEEVERQLGEIKDALNSLSSNMVRTDRFESKVHDIEELQAAMKEQDTRDDGQDKRIAGVEGFQTILKYVGGLIVLIIVAVVTTWATGLI